jgi:hypothetical protein
MWDVLGFILECIFEAPELFEYWRFCLPVLAAVALAALIHWRIANDGAQLALSAPVLLAGISTGIVWQIRRRRNRW